MLYGYEGKRVYIQRDSFQKKDVIREYMIGDTVYRKKYLKRTGTLGFWSTKKLAVYLRADF